jgi:hypothetical protein
MKKEDFPAIVFIILTFVAFTYFCGYMNGRENTRLDAIKNGAAEYRIVNQETGKTKFFWKGTKPNE